MSEHRDVPVAYVTKWATTRGILVVKGAETHVGQNGAVYLTKGALFVDARHWTEDKDEAERRYAAALKRRERALGENLKAIRQAISDGSRYTEES